MTLISVIFIIALAAVLMICRTRNDALTVMRLESITRLSAPRHR
jgi:hypothetical protein